MPEPVPPPSPDDRWAGLRATFAPKQAPDEGELNKLRGAISGPSPPLDQALDALRKAVDDAAGLLRALTFTYLAVWAYVIIAAGSVTHRQLLIGTDVQLPLLSTGVDLETFF